MWHWDDELVVGFTLGTHKLVKRGHARDKSLPFVNVQERSSDGGESWQLEDFNGARPGSRGLSADEHMHAGLRLSDVLDDWPPTIPTRPLSFSHPDFALMAARTDYLVQGDQSALLFLTANKTDGQERKVICARTEDGGRSFELLAEVGREPPDAGDFAIMPASLLLPSGRILCARRCRRGVTGASWIDLYASDDHGRSW